MGFRNAPSMNWPMVISADAGAIIRPDLEARNVHPRCVVERPPSDDIGDHTRS